MFRLCNQGELPPHRVRGEGVHREENEVERIMMNGESMVCLVVFFFFFLIHGALARKKSLFFFVCSLQVTSVMSDLQPYGL